METKEREFRNFTVSEIRAATAEDGQKKISGYAAVFNELSDDLGGFKEKVAPGAFTATLEKDDIRSLWNHNSDYPLGRVKARTLSVSQDLRGLKFEINPPDTQYARDLLVSIERGDVNQMSFSFFTDDDNWENVNGVYIRTLLAVTLLEVSPVTFPAYPQTSAVVRSKIAELNQADQAVDPEASVKAAAQVRAAIRKRNLQILNYR